MPLKGDEVASRAIIERGYLVVGFLEFDEFPKVGDRLENWAGMELSQPIVLIEPTTIEDWKEQCRILSPPFTKDAEVPREKTTCGRFFRAITD
jgi:hypothetical protein